MALITWNDTLSVGVPELDEQHKKLIKMINDLHDAMRGGKGNAAMGTILDGLISYTGYHFTAEEGMMKAAGYQDLDAHKKVHDSFTNKVADLKENFNNGKTTLSVETMKFLSDWLTSHIKGTDKQYMAVLAPNAKASV